MLKIPWWLRLVGYLKHQVTFANEPQKWSSFSKTSNTFKVKSTSISNQVIECQRFVAHRVIWFLVSFSFYIFPFTFAGLFQGWSYQSTPGKCIFKQIGVESGLLNLGGYGPQQNLGLNENTSDFRKNRQEEGTDTYGDDRYPFPYRDDHVYSTPIWQLKTCWESRLLDFNVDDLINLK